MNRKNEKTQITNKYKAIFLNNIFFVYFNIPTEYSQILLISKCPKSIRSPL